MQFVSLSVRNFGPFGPTQKFDFTKHKGLVLIEGVNKDDASVSSNGAGKSSLIHALCWCLYDRTAHGLSKDSVVYRNRGKNCAVEVEMRDEATTWIVRRWRKVKGKHGIVVFRDGEDVSGRDMFETQQKINTLLGMTSSTFINTIVFGQTVAYRFSQLSDAQQKEILDDALGVGVYAKAATLARGEASEVSNEVSMLERVLEQQKHELAAAQTRFDDAKAAAQEYGRSRKSALAEAENAHKSAIEHIARLKHQLRGWEDLDDKMKGAESALRSAESKIVAIGARVSGLRIQVKELEEHIAAIEERGEGACTECGQEITANWLDKHSLDLQNRAEKARNELREVTDRLRRKRKVVTAREAACDTLRAQWTKRSACKHELSALRTRATELQRDVDRYKVDGNQFLVAKEEAEKDLETRTIQFGKDRLRMQELERKRRYYAFWAEAFGARGLRSLIIDHSLPMLNEKVEQYSQLLTEGNIKIEFKTQSEQKSGKLVDKFQVAVDNKWGAGEYKANSAGEQSKVDLCVGLALQSLVTAKTNRKLNIAFFDEPFERLDPTAMDYVMTLLSEELKQRDAVYVITHQDSLKTFFPRVVRVVKEQGTSKIEE